MSKLFNYTYKKHNNSIIQEYWKRLVHLTQLSTTAFSDFEKDVIHSKISSIFTIHKSHGDIWPSLYASQAMDYYRQLNFQQKVQFLKILEHDFGIDQDRIADLALKYLQKEQERERTEKELRLALIPMYQLFFDRIHQLPGGLSHLMNMRQDILVYSFV